MITRYTIPASGDGVVARWLLSAERTMRLRYLEFSLTTTAAAGGRTVWFEVVDGADQRIGTIASRALQNANATTRNVWFQSATTSLAIIGPSTCYTFPMPELEVPAGAFVVLRTLSMQAGDAFSDIIIHATPE